MITIIINIDTLNIFYYVNREKKNLMGICFSTHYFIWEILQSNFVIWHLLLLFRIAFNDLRKSQQFSYCFRVGGKGNKTRKLYDTDGWILDHTRWILKITERYRACSFLHLTGFFWSFEKLIINAPHVSCRQIVG